MIHDPFNYSGFASLNDIASVVGRSLFKELEEFQKEFSIRVENFRSPEYSWPKDPLHTWSRVWEYPYVLYHLRKWKQKIETEIDTTPRNLTIVDLGSGVTFFPFFLARNGYKIKATDIDPVCEKDFKNAINLMNMSTEKIDFILCKEDYIPLNENSVSCVYSISVIEHVKNISPVIKEVHRVLEPNGLFILTFDIALTEGHELSPQRFNIFLSTLNKYFEFIATVRIVHPLEVLCSSNGPFPLHPERTLLKEILHFGNKIAKRILRIKRTLPLHLACAGCVVRKK